MGRSFPSCGQRSESRHEIIVRKNASKPFPLITFNLPHVNREVGVEADEGRRLEEEDDLDPEQVALPHVLPEPSEALGRPLPRQFQHALRFLIVLLVGFGFGFGVHGQVFGHGRNLSPDIVIHGRIVAANFQIGHRGAV